MSEIIPALLPKDPQDLKEKVSALPAEINFIHLDVLEDDIWSEFDKSYEAHLMVKEPERIMPRWIERGAKRVIVHEITSEILDYRGKVKIGLEIEMNELLEKKFEQVPLADFIHIMSIDEIGEQGHPFNPRVFDRIKQVRARFPKITISVDGGVNKDNYQKLIETGADRIIIGSHFKEVWSRTKQP